MAHGSVKQGGELSALLTVDDACIALGISRSAGYRAIAAGALPAVRWGRRVYVPSGHLVTLLGKHGGNGGERDRPASLGAGSGDAWTGDGEGRRAEGRRAKEVEP